VSDIHRTSQWLALSKRMRALFKVQVDAGTAVCVDCGRPIYPGQRWAVGHIIAASEAPHLAYMEWNLGPTHHGKQPGSQRNCNQIAGGQMGAAKTNAKKARAEGNEYPKWY
jgi:hypothetical protein